MSWKKVRLGNACDVFNGKTPPKSEQRATGFPVLKIKDVDEHRKFKGIFESYVDDSFAQKSATKIVKEKDVLILNAAHSVTHVASKMYLAQKSVVGALATGEWTMVRTKDDHEPNFVYYFLNSSYGKNQLKDAVKGIHLYPKDVANLQIPLPPLPTQKHIASILDKADALRQQNRQLLEHYDALLQSTFIEMFGDPVENPKGWEVKPVIDSCEKCIVPGRDKPKSFTGNIPWITTDDLIHLWKTERSKKDMGLNLSEVNEVKARLIPKDSVIMTCVGDLGVISIAGRELLMNQQLHAFICGDKIINHFLAYVLSLRTDFMYKMASTTTVPYMNKTVCNSIPIILPPISHQQHFAKIVEQIESQKHQAQASLAESEALFQGLLAGYFGEN